ncbi:putative ferric-chelate reductase 1 [Fundulus heteroclitus]|uniref:putative ferric-chelate reductase 1 n=1 Tax=Fundulus heteroclitus TaxID=8078 RepID=UPI00165A683B|nr:putative ferric-chelate reductase 1 [Fundulus heteroclitus]
MARTMIQLIATMMVVLTLDFQPVLSQVNITRTGCGMSKFCLEEPQACDPASNATCLFGSLKPTALNVPNGLDVSFELSGNSSGYIAVGLTQDLSMGSTMLFICGNNGTFFTASMTSNNTNPNEPLGMLMMNMTDIANSTEGENIKCTFNVAGLNATSSQTRAAADSTFFVVIGSGMITGDRLGPFTSARNSSAIDLSAFLPNSTNTTTPSSGANHPLYSNAVLPLLSFLTLSILKFA